MGAPTVIVLSDRLWRDRFGARRDALGQEIIVNGVPHTVIGVMPPGFEFPNASGAWTTMRLDPLSNRGNHSWQVTGRLKPNVSIEQARRDLARTASRAREIAVRVALGADRWRVVRQLLTESLLVALAGASLGIAFAWGFLQWIKASILGGIPFWMRFTIDGPVLVVGEIALSLVLLTGATLLMKSFVGMQRVKPGFDPSNLLTMRVTLTGPKYDSTFKRYIFWDALLANLNAKPGVVSAAITNNIPLSGSNNNFFNVEGQETPLGSEPLLENRWVSPRYLETMRVPLVSGRMFTQQEWADSGATGRVAVINEYMARRFWKTAEAAIGKRFSFGMATDTSRKWITIVGVAADIKHKRLTAAPDLQGYIPYRQGGWNSAAIVVRTVGEPAAATRTALVLAAVGVYGVISYTVSQRTQELGVRVALGAQRGDVMRLIVGHGAALGAMGVGIGLAGIVLLASYLPARRAMGIDPVEALRND